MAKNKKVEILSNDKEVLHPMTDGDCVIFEDGQTLTQKLSEDDSVKYTPEIVNSSPMFKVGEGNTVDYSDNVLDGAYERATLQGQTYVNYIQESSADEVTLPTPFTEYERTQHNTLTSDEEGVLGINLVGQSYVNALQHDSEEEFVVLGESLEFQEKKVEYTNEGQIKSAMLKGQTLVNIFKSFANYSYSESELGVKWLIGGAAPLTETLNNDELTMTITGVGSKVVRMDDISMLKPNTKYMVKINYTTSFENQINFGYFNNSLIYTQIASMKSNEYAIFTTPNDLSTWVGLWFGILSDLQVGDVMTISKPVLIEYQDGMENWDIPYFEGMQSVTVSTRLENKLGTFSGTVSTSKTGKTFTTTDGASRSLHLYNTATASTNPINLKPNTKYLIQFAISNLVLDGLAGVNLIWSDSTLASGNCLFGENTNVRISENGTYRTILTTTDLIATSSFVVKGYTGDWENSGSSLRSLTISNIMCIEYQNGMENWDLPYFEDYQVMKPVQVESVNKNLFDGELEVGTIATSDGTNVNASAYNQYCRTKNYIKVQPSTSYNIVYDIDYGNTLFYFYSSDKAYITNSHTTTVNDGTNTGKVTTPNNCEYMKFRFVNNSELVNDKKIMLEESSTATEYVPHQSKTTYSWDEVILRKVGDVEDTLDLTTGEWVQRIGEVTLDGSETWKMDAEASANNSCMFFTGVDFGGFQHFEHYEDREKYQLCDKFKIKADAYYLDENCIMVNQDARIYCRILKTQLSSPDVTGFQEWLKTNNVKISTLLAKPIVHKVNLSRPNLQVYDDITHVHTKCLDGTLIPNIYLPSDVSYPAILEPGKKYNVCVNHTEVSADNPLKVNVGGTEITMTDSRMTLTTPTTLANSNVSFTGKGNKIKESMLIKNSSLLTRDLPHFNGIGSVQLGKTIENLCGSNCYMSGVAAISPTFGQNSVQFTITKAGSCVWVFPIIRPLINGKKYFVYAPNTYPSASSAHVSFRHLYDNQLTFAYGEMIYPISKYTTFTINQDKNQFSHIVIGNHGSVPLNSQCTLTYPIICEYEPGMENWDWETIGYFTGTKNIGNEFMRVQNKNFYPYGDSSFTGQQGNTWYWLNGKGCSFGESCVKKNMGNAFYLKKGSYVLSYNDNNSFQTNFIQLVGEYEKIVNPKNIEQDGWYAIRVKTTTDNIPVNITNIQIEESSTATTYTAHKHNGLYVTKDQPINLTWEQGAIFYESGVSWSQMTNNVNSMRIRTPQPLTLEPNKTYRVSLGSDKYQYGIQLYNGSNNGVFDYGWNTDREFIFTTTKDKYKVGIAVGKIDSSNNTPITPSEINHVRLEEVTDVVLRSCSGKYDELDLTRGTYIQNVGRVYLDGINALSRLITLVGDSYQPTDTTLKTFDIRCDGAVVDGICLSNRFPMRESMPSADINLESVRIHSTAASCRLTIKKEKASTVDEFKLWLQDNPLEIIYALKTPIIHKVHIGNKNEANTEVAKPNDVFTLPTLYTEQTHIDLTNNGIVPKVQSRDYIAYPVLPMIGRTYTLQHNLTGGVSNLTVDLLGRTQQITYQNHKSLVYSPETMDAVLHNELRISGKGKISGVMYIDGGYMDRNIPYIEGMKNAVNPIVKNVGKNLFDGVVKNGESWWDGKTGIIARCRRSVNLTPVKPNTEYVFKLTNRYGIGCGANFMAHGKDGKFLKYIGWVLSDTGKFTTPSDCYYIHWYNDIDDFTDFYIEEVSTSSQYEPYKENICYVDCGEIRLTPDMFEQGSVGAASAGSHYNSDKTDSSYRIRTKELIKLEIGEQYVFLGNNDKYKYSARFYDMDGNKKISHGTTYDLSWKGNTPFTILNDAPMCAFFVKKANDSVITVDDIEAFNFQLVKVSEIKQLRSLPHGVQDEIDLETGTYVQRVGEITFDGTESWQPGYSAWDNKRTYYNNSFVDIKTMKGDNGSGAAYYDAVRCPQLHRTYMSRLASALIDGVCSYYYSGYQRIFISKQDCATVDELKLWLQENPITVQYELPEPIVKDIVIHNYPHSYEGGHVIIENGDPNTPIPAQLTYRAVTNRSGQIQQHTEQVEKQEREINELETLILANIHLSQTR